MKYYDRFSGRLSHEDPRTPVTAAGGCVWPTIPAHRYYLFSNNALGKLIGLRTKGALFERQGTTPDHDEANWSMIDGPPEIVVGKVWKYWLRDDRLIRWWVWLVVDSACPVVEKEWETPEGSCNLDIYVGNAYCPDPNDGSLGNNAMLYQTEWNKTKPPGF